VDTGMTLNYILRYLAAKNPASLRVCALLDKRARRLVNVPLDYVGFEIGDEFVVVFYLANLAHPLVGLPHVCVDVEVPGAVSYPGGVQGAVNAGNPGTQYDDGHPLPDGIWAVPASGASAVGYFSNAADDRMEFFVGEELRSCPAGIPPDASGALGTIDLRLEQAGQVTLSVGTEGEVPVNFYADPQMDGWNFGAMHSLVLNPFAIGEGVAPPQSEAEFHPREGNPPGDYNGGGSVSIDDLTPLALNVGTAIDTHPELAHLDGNGDGIIDVLDMLIMVLHFGESAT